MPAFNSFVSSLATKRRKRNSKSRHVKKRIKASTTQTPSPKTFAAVAEGGAVESSAESVKEQEEELEEVGDREEAGGFELKSSAFWHNHAIQPLGNLLLREPSSNIRDHGLGALHALPDELLVDIFSLLGACELGRLAAVSKSLYIFSTHEPLWRSLVLEELKGDFFFTGSWRSTYISHSFKQIPPISCIRIRDFFSDYLFQSWLCANLEMKPQWLQTDNIRRRRGISVEQFIADFEEPNRPVLLEGCMERWLAMKKWGKESLVKACKGARFAVGPVEMKLEDFFRYADNVREERPLYLFDSKFAEKVPEMGVDYEIPEYFREDLFSVLGDERPDYRWIIIGPAGSGSSFHVDPNSTSAWNAVIRGSKKWVMFPPEVVPPGVHPSPDGAEVACPVSIIEWFMNFYQECKKWKKQPIECVCRAGEIVFVPNGWWHLVINLEDSIAITQNYVSRRNLLNVLDFLKRPNASELVSGTKDRVGLYDKFRCALETSYAGIIDLLEKKAEEKLAKQTPTFWESADDANTGGFRFSF